MTRARRSGARMEVIGPVQRVAWLGALPLASCLARPVPEGWRDACEVTEDCPEPLVCRIYPNDAGRFDPETTCNVPCEARRDCPTEGGNWDCVDGACSETFPK